MRVTSEGKPTAEFIGLVDELLKQQDVIKIAVGVTLADLFYIVLQNDSQGFILHRDGDTFLLHKHPFVSHRKPPSGPYDSFAFQCFQGKLFSMMNLAFVY